VLLLAVYAGQCLWFVGTQSFTFDEPIHLFTGLRAWQGRFDMWNDHPPLSRMLFAVPLLRHGIDLAYIGISPGPMAVHGMRSNPVGIGWRTRPLNVALGVLLGVLLWLLARRLFSESAANLALALFAFSPGMIAHFSVATTDGAGILTIFATAFQLMRWRRDPSRRNTALLGLVLAALLLAKFYTLPMFLLALALVLALKGDSIKLRPRDWNWRPAMLAAAIAVVIVSGVYSFHITRLRFRDGVMTAFIPGREIGIVTAVPVPGKFSLLVPAGEYGDGLRYVSAHNAIGHNSYLLGEVRRFGFRSYWPIVIVLKWPAVVLLLFVTALVLVAKRRIILSRDLLVISAFPLALAAMLAFSHIQIGDRHALTLYPFLLLLIAGVWHAVDPHLPNAGRCGAPSKRRWLKAALVGLVLLQAVDTLRIAPDYLSYFNVWVRPGEAYKMVSDSNLDWGQGLIALREWQVRHPEPLRVAYFGTMDPKLYGVSAQPLHPGERATGKIAVSMSNISGQYLADPNAYKWLLQYPREIVNHSIFVFDVPTK
jgi:Dolichyl-phosphate-mannose-protein mannosyltransferase